MAGSTKLLTSSGGGVILTPASNIASDVTASIPSSTGTLGMIQNNIITAGTAVASTSGTSIDFTSIPSGVKRITVMLNGVSLSSTANLRLQLGTGGSPETSGYIGAEGRINNVPSAGYLASSGSGFEAYDTGAARNNYFTFVFTNISGNTWMASWTGFNDGGFASYGAGAKTLSGTLNMVRVTTTSTDTFDAGSINVFWE